MVLVQLISDLFWLYINDCYLIDDCLQYIFQSKHAAITDMHEQFSTTACQRLVLYLSFYCSLVGIAPVCITAFGFYIFSYFSAMYWGINVFINLSAHGVFGSVLL